LKIIQTILLSCAITLTCSIQIGSSSEEVETEFDLANYFFHRNLNTEGGEFSYSLNYYWKKKRRKHLGYAFKMIKKGASFDHYYGGKIALYYLAKDEYIEQRWPNSDTALKRKRHVNVGDTYVNNHHLKVGITDDCSVLGSNLRLMEYTKMCCICIAIA